MIKIKIVYFAAISFIILAGCASLNSNAPFYYEPTLLPQAQTIDKVVGVEILQDKRLKEDIACTKSITDVSEKVTAKLIEDFKSSGVFKEIHYGRQAGDDLMISGSIDRFIWKLYTHPLNYIPLLCVVGTPTFNAYGIAVITLEVKDNKTGALIATLRGSSKIENSFTVYNFKVADSGTELEDAFREAARQLKEGLSAKVGQK